MSFLFKEEKLLPNCVKMGGGDFSVVEIIRQKRDKGELSEKQIRTFIARLVTKIEEDRIHDAQIGGFPVFIIT